MAYPQQSIEVIVESGDNFPETVQYLEHVDLNPNGEKFATLQSVASTSQHQEMNYPTVYSRGLQNSYNTSVPLEIYSQDPGQQVIVYSNHELHQLPPELRPSNEVLNTVLTSVGSVSSQINEMIPVGTSDVIHANPSGMWEKVYIAPNGQGIDEMFSTGDSTTPKPQKLYTGTEPTPSKQRKIYTQISMETEVQESKPRKQHAKTKYQCTYCNKVFPQRSNLRRHLVLHTGDRGYRCGRCGKSYTQAIHLKRHAIARDAKAHVCNYCCRGFATKEGLEKHKDIHEGNKRGYVCTVCSLKFAKSHQLMEHLTTHTKYKPHVCTICRKNFARRNNLKVHIVCHMKDCDMCCGVKYDSKQSLLQHMMLIHTKKESIASMVSENVEPSELSIMRVKKKTVPKLKMKPTPYKKKIQIDQPDGNSKTSVVVEYPNPYSSQDKIRDAIGPPKTAVVLNSQPPVSRYTHSILPKLKKAVSMVPGISPAAASTQSIQSEPVTQTVHEAMPQTVPQFPSNIINFDNGFGVGQRATIEVVVESSTATKSKQKRSIPSGDITCTICGKCFTRKSGLQNHMLIHTGEKPHKCTVCSRQFTQAIHLKLHMLTHTGEKPHPCPYCDKRFTRPSHVQMHVRTHTGGQIKPHKCHLCPKAFTQSMLLRYHIRSHTGEKPHACTKCDKRFTHVTYLRQHLRVHSGDKKYSCDICAKTFLTSSELAKHRRVHVVGTPYKCSVCNKGFKQIIYLMKHAVIHSDVLPYKCNYCHKSFSRAPYLKKHLTLHKTKTKTEFVSLDNLPKKRPYTCPECNMMFKKFSNLKQHARIHRITVKITPTCTECNAEFETPKKLKFHLLSHKKWMNRICPVCLMDFSKPYNLKRHLLSHKKFTCYECGMSVEGEEQLQEHMLSHSTDHTVKQLKEEINDEK